MASLRKRGSVYYAQYYVGKRQIRKCLDTTNRFSRLQGRKDKRVLRHSSPKGWAPRILMSF